MQPSDAYEAIFQPDAEKLDICGTAVLEMQEDPDTEVVQAVNRGLATQDEGFKPDLQLRKFVESQLRAWIKANFLFILRLSTEIALCVPLRHHDDRLCSLSRDLF